MPARGPGVAVAVAELSALSHLVENKIVGSLAEIQKDGLALYATRPGTLVSDFRDPTDPDDALPVGPLARRMILALMPSASKQHLTLQELLHRMDAEVPVSQGDAATGWPENPPKPYRLGTPSATLLDNVSFGLSQSTAKPDGAVERRTGSGLIASE